MPVKREVEKQSWTGILSPKQLSGQVIWILAIALAGTLLAAGFNPAIFGSSDTEDNQAAATGEESSRTDGQLAPLSVIVTQTGLAVGASTSAYRGSVVWQYQFVNVGERCEPELFAGTPNDPAIHGGNLLTIPSSPNQQDFYRNAWVCFKAADQLGRQAYEVFNINLGNPTISIPPRAKRRPGLPPGLFQRRAHFISSYQLGADRDGRRRRFLVSAGRYLL